jgi:hypothetical protein
MMDTPLLLLFTEPESVVQSRLDYALERNAMIYPGSSRRLQPRILVGWSDDLPGAADVFDVFANVDMAAMKCGLLAGYDPRYFKKYVPLIMNKAPFCELAVLGEEVGAAAVVWQPQSIVTQFKYFADTVGYMECGGPFPMMATMRFDAGDNGNIDTRGLAWFADQEIAFASSHLATPEAVKRVVRFVNYIARHGRIEACTTFDGMERGEKIDAQPSPDCAILHLVVRLET